MHDAKMSQTEMNSTRKITLGSGDKSLVVTIISHVVHGFALSTGSAAQGLLDRYRGVSVAVVKPLPIE